jgi:hypothetical protein
MPRDGGAADVVEHVLDGLVVGVVRQDSDRRTLA